MTSPIDLTDSWTLTRHRVDGSDETPGGSDCTVDGDVPMRFAATLPTTVGQVLLESGAMPDPYVGSLETAVQPFFDDDYTFTRTVDIPADLLDSARVDLVCEQLVTLATVEINGTVVGRADNMHRPWRFSVGEALREGENTLSVRFSSSARYAREHASAAGKPFASLRQAACMFGWDWGLSLPDMGVTRGIRLEAVQHARLDALHVRQEHTADEVTVTVGVELADAAIDPGANLLLRAALRDPAGSNLGTCTVEVAPQDGDPQPSLQWQVADPQLWWPAGMGEHPLYELEVDLLDARRGEHPISSRVQRVGLRTIELDRTRDENGADFTFVVNGVRIFAAGHNLIIDDAFVTRTDPDRWNRHIRDVLESNANMIRVWGGAFLPDEEFYRRCDEVGLLVWQDFAFASSFYPPTPELLGSIREELTHQVRWLRNHACLALLCGNNEVESVLVTVTSAEERTAALRSLFGAPEPLSPEKAEAIWSMYSVLFLEMMTPLVRSHAPQVPFVHSSPSTPKPGEASSFFDYTTNGDMHYYFPYDGNAEVSSILDMRCRFMSEMGFQSYPAMETIAQFATSEDLDPYSEVMLAHQKCQNGNEAIELYMEREYTVPQDFALYTYLSQVLAGEVMRFSMDHFRRQAGYCHGLLIWQLNDCWPVVSWSGVDYYGRWKAQQYYARRFFQPVAPQVAVDHERGRVQVWVTNISARPVEAEIVWGTWLEQEPLQVPGGAADGSAPGAGAGAGRASVRLEPQQAWMAAEWSVAELDADQLSRAHTVVELLDQSGHPLARDSRRLVPARAARWVNPQLSAAFERTAGGEVAVRVTSTAYTEACEIRFGTGLSVLEDNFLALEAGESRLLRVLRVEDGLPTDATTGLPTAEIHLRSLWDVLGGVGAAGAGA